MASVHHQPTFSKRPPSTAGEGGLPSSRHGEYHGWSWYPGYPYDLVILPWSPMICWFCAASVFDVDQGMTVCRQDILKLLSEANSECAPSASPCRRVLCSAVAWFSVLAFKEARQIASPVWKIWNERSSRYQVDIKGTTTSGMGDFRDGGTKSLPIYGSCGVPKFDSW